MSDNHTVIVHTQSEVCNQLRFGENSLLLWICEYVYVYNCSCIIHSVFVQVCFSSFV